MTDNKNTRKKTAGRKKKAASHASKSQKSAAAVSDTIARQNSSPIPEGTKFEDAFDELEQIVGSLEDGEQSLQDSLAQFERGIALARFCQHNLAQAEQTVMVLTSDMSDDSADDNTTESLKPFDMAGNSDSE